MVATPGTDFFGWRAGAPAPMVAGVGQTQGLLMAKKAKKKAKKKSKAKKTVLKKRKVALKKPAAKKRKKARRAKPKTIGGRIADAYRTVVDTVKGTDTLRNKMEQPGTSESE